ncbi:hypothetical protein SDC9_155721 [bioreactor metagenome]|uniref:Uncharacterized protein n=1 Tax=bioreactor metagenome TaxID=1076179 RepID=A0A645F4T4_9ZZZZ
MLAADVDASRIGERCVFHDGHICVRVPHVDQDRRADTFFFRNDRKRRAKLRRYAHGNLDIQRGKRLLHGADKFFLHIHVRNERTELLGLCARRESGRNHPANREGDGRAMHEDISAQLDFFEGERDDVVDILRHDALASSADGQRGFGEDHLAKRSGNGDCSLADAHARLLFRLGDHFDNRIV